MRRLRFCHVTTFYPPYSMGGDAIFVRRLARLLVERGHHVEVVHCLDSYRLLADDEPRACEQDKVIVHQLASPLGALSPVLTYATGYPLLKRARLQQILASGFDVINFHNISLVGGPMVTSLGRGLKLYTAHEYWHLCPTHLLLKWGKRPCQTKHCLACTLYQRRPPQLWRYLGIMERGLANIDLFLYGTNWARDLHRQAGISGQAEVLPPFASPPTSTDTGEPRSGFLFVGRLVDVKGILELLSLFRERTEFPLTVVGDGPLRGRVEELASGRPHIRVLGSRTGDELSRLYRQAQGVLIPSKSHEIGPLVLLEALAHATPVVVSAMGEMPRIAQLSGAGLVARNPDDWLEALDYLWSQPERVAGMGVRGRAFYQANYTPERYIQRYLELIESGMAGPSRCRQKGW